jgi:aspartate racemase
VLIGLLGGMSWESSAEYYRLLNELTRERRGDLHSAECLLWSVDFAEIEGYQERGEWDAAGARLADAAQGLERAGADFLVLCTNTMHKVAPAIEAAVGIPLLHLVDATAETLRTAGVTRVGLLGTRFTMEDGFYTDRMAEQGISCLVPGAEEREVVHRVIYDELCLGVVRNESRATYVDVVAGLAARGAEGVILGCTEIELLLHQEDVEIPAFLSTRLHVEAALARVGHT